MLTKYKQTIGSLMYLGLCTRPDILFTVNKASRKSKNPSYEGWFNLLKVFRYLKGNKNYGIKFNKDNLKRAYVDSDYGGDEITRRSTTGIIILIGTGPVGWYSKLQHIVSSSTAESEYYALGTCANQCVWYENILNELGENCKCININIDNKAAIYISENETINQNKRHIDIKYHFVRDYVKENKISFALHKISR